MRYTALFVTTLVLLNFVRSAPVSDTDISSVENRLVVKREGTLIYVPELVALRHGGIDEGDEETIDASISDSFRP